MEERYQEVLEKYYKLKQKYEKKERNRKRNFPTREKKCIVCQKNGGTIFKQKKKILTATCGCNKKCKLNIQIKLAKYIYAPYVIKELRYFLEELKQRILEVKLDHMFDFKTEKEVAKTFDKMKSVYSKQLELLENLKELVSFTPKPIEEISELYELIGQYKKAIDDYIKTKEKNYLTDAVEIYIERIHPKQIEIREIMYETMYIGKDEDNHFKLMQNMKNIQSLEKKISSGKIISNIS